MSVLMKWKSGGRQTGSETNPELLRTDEIVRLAEKRLRMVLIRHFCTRGTIRQKAAKHGEYGVPKSTYWDLLDEAVWYVHTEYDASLAQADKIRYMDAIVVIPTAIQT